VTDPDGVAEREFFREEFRRGTIVLALGDPDVDATIGVVGELTAGECQVIVVARHTDLAASQGFDTGVAEPPASMDDLATLWNALEDTGVQVIGVDDDPAGHAADLAGRLGVAKLAITDAGGGWGRSFASADDLGEGAATRPVVADAVRRALVGGVGGVNVCRAVDLDVELFTFDGAGTLFSSDAYVQVSRLRADDLAVVEQLVARGVAEGHLRPRPRREVVRLALGGLGARVGPGRHLAGFGALEVERYVAEKLVEITCLYTVNRYEGEGVAGRLVDGLLDAARRTGVRAVFACTVSRRAAALFERSGFCEVPQDRIPAAKWIDYDVDRRRRLSTHWFDLDRGDSAEPGSVASASVPTSCP
jgi:amino-acid N-acetyltransferase